MTVACRICGVKRWSRGLMCRPCGKSYDRDSFNGGTIWEAIAWAAKRARFFERRRQREAVRS